MTTVRDIDKYYKRLKKHLRRRRKQGILWSDLPGMGQDKSWFNIDEHLKDEHRRKPIWRTI